MILFVSINPDPKNRDQIIFKLKAIDMKKLNGLPFQLKILEVFEIINR